MTASLLILNFTNFLTMDYIKSADGQDFPRLICWIYCFSPTIQLLFGIFFIQYRYVVYVLQNSGLNSDSHKISSDYEVEPFSEYGAQNQYYILLGQIGGYFLFTVLFLRNCKSDPPNESGGEIISYKDSVEVPVEIKNEADRIAGLVN